MTLRDVISLNQNSMALFKSKEKKTILIVEDDALLAQVLMDKFGREEFIPVNVVNGLDVQAKAAELKPAIILLDLILPGIDGFEVLKLLRADDKTKKIPVVVISNLGEESDVRSAKALGAEDYFIKANISMEKLMQNVRKIAK